MPPRDQLLLSLRALSLRSSFTPSQASRAFTSSAVDHASTVQQRRRHRDPYALAQSRARKAANLSRQEVLKVERSAALGDPVRGTTTAFVQSFDNAPASLDTPGRTSGKDQSVSDPKIQDGNHLNFFVNQDEVAASLRRSDILSSPASRSHDQFQEEETQRKEEEHARGHVAATEALKRIAALENGSSKDRLRVNIQRCISTFGRHNTEKELAPRAPTAVALAAAENHQEMKMERAGPDTGSSEVQIAILTAKIRTLADFLETRGKGDKVNKRNLRLLVHRRQKLLSYLRRKERGGPRWQNCIETLGLTEGTWKGEISL